MTSSVTLAAIVRAACLHPVSVVVQTLYHNHSITTAIELQTLLANADAARALPHDWSHRLRIAVATLLAEEITPRQWRPNGHNSRLRLVVMQGDLTACPADAIVNPATHGAGLALAIEERGGRIVRDEGRALLREHQSLDVGKAMTSSGSLPCQFVIHTVGPKVGGHGTRTPTRTQARQLHQSVWNALLEADQLGLKTIAIPGISSGCLGIHGTLPHKKLSPNANDFVVYGPRE